MATKMLYRVLEAVETTGISRSTLYELMASGQLESVKIGKSRLIPHDALEAFVTRLRQDGAEDRPAQ